MRFRVRQIAPLLAVSLLAAGCAASDQQQATQDLNDRLQLRLAADVKDGNAVLAPLPDGAQVTVPDPTLFPGRSVTLNDKGRLVLTYVIQALLDPSIMKVTVSGSPDVAPALQGPRTRAVTTFFSDHGLGQIVDTASAPPAGVAPMTIAPAAAAAPAPGVPAAGTVKPAWETPASTVTMPEGTAPTAPALPGTTLTISVVPPATT